MLRYPKPEGREVRLDWADTPVKAGGSGRKCLPSGLVTDFREGAPACIKGLLKVAASAQGGSVPDPMAGGSCGPSALRRPRDKACPQRARPENQPAFALSHHLFCGHFRQGWLWRQIAECVSEAGFQVLLTVPQEAQVAVCGAHWCSRGRPPSRPRNPSLGLVPSDTAF